MLEKPSIEVEKFKKLKFIQEKLETRFPIIWKYCSYLDQSNITMTGSSSIVDNDNLLQPLVDVIYGELKVRQLFGRHENPFKKGEFFNEFYFCKGNRTSLDTFYALASNLEAIPENSLLFFEYICGEFLKLHEKTLK